MDLLTIECVGSVLVSIGFAENQALVRISFRLSCLINATRGLSIKLFKACSYLDRMLLIVLWHGGLLGWNGITKDEVTAFLAVLSLGKKHI